jgi:tRNA-dihydrouridine synthase B
MIGRAAQGRPWIFREVAHYLSHGSELASPLVAEVKRLLLHHLQDHYSLYGKHLGVRSARKHIAWYTHGLSHALAFRKSMNAIDDCDLQLLAVANYFDGLAQLSDRYYPANPNGSPEGLTAVTTPDGRFTAMMPHPERVFRNVQMSYTPEDVSAFSPWLRMWQNARRWIK